MVESSFHVTATVAKRELPSTISVASNISFYTTLMIVLLVVCWLGPNQTLAQSEPPPPSTLSPNFNKVFWNNENCDGEPDYSRYLDSCAEVSDGGAGLEFNVTFAQNNSLYHTIEDIPDGYVHAGIDCSDPAGVSIWVFSQYDCIPNQATDPQTVRLPPGEDGSNFCMHVDGMSYIFQCVTEAPSTAPSASPSESPSETPSASPSVSPSETPSASPSASPSAVPSTAPSVSPSAVPSTSPSKSPSKTPSTSPSTSPSKTPSRSPSASPSASPSNTPSASPTTSPSISPSTQSPSANPTTLQPSTSPTPQPTSGVCIPKMKLNKKACQKRIKQCNKLNIKMKWTGPGCKIGRKKMGDGGCQCRGYCGYQCAKVCRKDRECKWEHGVCVQKSGVPVLPGMGCFKLES